MLGTPTPFPIMNPSGTWPPMTDSGAAAANTINTIAPAPREPCKRLRSIGLAGEEDEGGMVETGLRA